MTTEIPTSFGFPTFIKSILPGFISVILGTYFILPFIPSHVVAKILLLPLTEKIILWLFTGIFFGMLITSLDQYIYKLFMGTGILPNKILDKIYSLMLDDFNGLVKNYEFKREMRKRQSANSDKYRSLTNEIISMSDKLRAYPFDIELGMTHPRAPTKLGNTIIEYESYSDVQYGMDFNVFWSRIWQVMSVDNRNDLDIRGARADFTVYLLFIWTIFFPFMAYSFYKIYGIGETILFLIFWMLGSKVIYNAAILLHNNYGGYIKAAFDVWRIDLAKKLAIPISLCPKRDERALWQEYREFLEDYNESEQEFLRKKF